MKELKEMINELQNRKKRIIEKKAAGVGVGVSVSVSWSKSTNSWTQVIN